MYGDILITQLNDFIFCPASIYFHNLYGETERFLYQSEAQINTMLHHKQYAYDGEELARFIVLNKIQNKKKVLGKLRYQTEAVTEAIDTLEKNEAMIYTMFRFPICAIRRYKGL